MLHVKNSELLSQLYEFTKTALPDSVLIHLWLKLTSSPSLPMRRFSASSCFVDRLPNPSIICGIDRVDLRGMKQYPVICIWSNNTDEDSLSKFLVELDESVSVASLASSSGEETQRGGVFCAVADYHCDAIKRYLSDKFDSITEYPELQYWIPPDKRRALSQMAIEAPDGFYFDKLQPGDIEFVNETWPYKLPDSQSHFPYSIENLPSVALRVKNTGQLASFEIIHGEHGYMNHLYTLEEFRRRGFAVKVEVKLAQIMITEYDIVPFKLVVQTNVAAKAMTVASPWWQDLGFKGSWIEFSNKRVEEKI